MTEVHVVSMVCEQAGIGHLQHAMSTPYAAVTRMNLSVVPVVVHVVPIPQRLTGHPQLEK